MSEQLDLFAKREKARQEILALKNKMSTGLVLNLFGRWFPKAISEQCLTYWLLQIAMLNAVVVLPAVLLSSIFGELSQWKILIPSWLVVVELAIYSQLLAHTLFSFTYHEIANHILHKITNEEEISDVVVFFKSFAASTFSYFVAGGVIWGTWTHLFIGEFLGFGLTYMVIFVGCLIGGSFQAIFLAVALTNRLKDFRYDLNTFTPANSELVMRISVMLNRFIYLTGAFFIVLTLLVSSGFLGSQVNKAFGLPLAFIGWAIILVQFFVNRSAINSIVEKERWTSLNKLQLQINDIQSTEDLSTKDVSEKILRLADIHERIRSNRAGAFDAKSLLSLFSQLMLPLLGLLLGNIDKVMEFFK